MAPADDLAFAPWDPAFVSDPYPANTALRDHRLCRTYQHRFTHEDFGRTASPPGHEPFRILNGVHLAHG
jgi:unspecific monooxygenase